MMQRMCRVRRRTALLAVACAADTRKVGQYRVDAYENEVGKDRAMALQCSVRPFVTVCDCL